MGIPCQMFLYTANISDCLYVGHRDRNRDLKYAYCLTKRKLLKRLHLILYPYVDNSNSFTMLFDLPPLDVHMLYLKHIPISSKLRIYVNAFRLRDTCIRHLHAYLFKTLALWNFTCILLCFICV